MSRAKPKQLQSSERLESPFLTPKNEEEVEKTLRPKILKEFIGQENIKKNLDIALQAAKKRNEPIEHVLLYGPPGLGKTTLAHIIANETGKYIHATSGPAIERAGDLAALLTNLQEGDILFIDEIHRMNKIIEEVLYPAMEEFKIDIIVGKGPSARTLKLDLPHFTLIGATTRLSLLSSPLRDRFGLIHRLNFYDDRDIKDIITRSSKLLSIAIDVNASSVLAKRSRKTPRIANRLLKRVRDFCEVKGDGYITEAVVNDALLLLQIDELGLDETDRKILEIIIEKFHGGPVGLNTIAAAISEEQETIAEIYEPFLMQAGLLARTPRGRVATETAYTHLDFAPLKGKLL